MEFDAYPELVLVALLQGIDQLAESESDNSLSTEGLSPSLGGTISRRTIKSPKNLEDAFETGDPVIDEYERQFAAGLTPDM